MMLKKWGKRIGMSLLIVLAVYVLACVATGASLMQLVYRVHEKPVEHTLFADVIPSEDDYRRMNENWYVAEASGQEVECKLSITFPITYIILGRAKAIYWMDYEAVDFGTACWRMPVIVEMVWDDGWIVERVTKIEFPKRDYGVTFP